MQAHAILGASAAYRWLICTPSARFEEQIPNEESEYAAEGTLAHDLAAHILSARAGLWKGTQAKYNAELARITSDPLYSAEMLEHCENYADFVRELGGKGDILIEHKFDLSEFVPLGYGTSDATKQASTALYVNDLKYGAGVRISAVRNPQMMLYGLGALAEIYGSAEGAPQDMPVVLSIYQPRAGGISTWETTVADLVEWGIETVRPQGLIAISGQGDFIPGKHCQFCRAKTMCRAYYDKFTDILDLTDKRIMSAEETAHVLLYGPMVASWVKKVEDEAVRSMQNGREMPGLKLVAGRSRRSFRSEDNLVEILIGENYDTEQIFDQKIKGITELEKLVGPKRFKVLFDNEIVQAAGRPQIVDISDDRQAIGASAADDFDDEYEDLT